MIVKKFQAPTEREAIIKAQEELGSTAVVLNVKTIKIGRASCRERV